jgi:hypothetical protein
VGCERLASLAKGVPAGWAAGSPGLIEADDTGTAAGARHGPIKSSPLFHVDDAILKSQTGPSGDTDDTSRAD